MDLLQSVKAQWLEQARLAAQRIAFETGSVTAEDVRHACPLAAGLHPNTMGKVFAMKDTFSTSGVKKSTIGSRKGGVIWVWRLTEKAEQQWRDHYSRRAG